jgi:hypothetical protein
MTCRPGRLEELWHTVSPVAPAFAQMDGDLAVASSPPYC